MKENFSLQFDSPAVFSLSSIRAGREAVFDLSVTNSSQEEQTPLTVEITSQPAFFAPHIITLGILPIHTKRIFPNLSLSYDRTFFSYLEEGVSAQITVSILSGGEVVTSHTRACDLMPYDAWGGVHFSPEMLSCLVTPMQFQVQDLVRHCRQQLQKEAPAQSAGGYSDSMDLSRVRKQALAVYSAIYDKVRSAGIIFSIQPPELTRRGTRVQLSEVTLAKCAGGALDAAILFASCAEAMSLHPVIVLSAGRLLVGGFVEPMSFSAPVVDYDELLKEAMRQDRLCLFEANSLAKGTSVGFSTACQLGQKCVRDITEFYCAIDVCACREAGLCALDNRVFYDGVLHFEKPGLSEEDDVFFNDTAIDEASPVPFVQHLRDMRRYLADFSPYNPMLSYPTDARIRLVVTEPERFYELLSAGEQCPFTVAAGAPFGFRGEESNAAVALDGMEKQVSSLPEEYGSVCLVFGLVRWKMKDAQGEAPLFYVPVQIQRQRGHLIGFCSLDAMPKVNVSLLHFIHDTFATDLLFLRELRAQDYGSFFKRAFFETRNALSASANLTLVENDVFFALIKSLSGDKLSAITAARVEGHPFSRAICAMEPMASEPFEKVGGVDAHPSAIPTPFALSSQALRICEAVSERDYTVVEAPPASGKTELGVSLAFSALNHTEKTVLYITGERSGTHDVMRLFEKAGIDDLVAPLTLPAPATVNYTMRETELFPYEEYFSLSTEVTEEQKRLLEYESILSERLTCGLTAEEAIYCFDHVRTASDVLHFSPESIGGLSEKRTNELQMVIRNLTAALSSIGTPVGHPLRYVRMRGFSYEIKAEAVRLLDEYSKKFKEYVTFLRGSCVGLFPKAKIRNESQEKAFLNLLKMIGEGRGINACYFEREIAAADLAKAETIFAYGRECCQMRTSSLSGLNAEAFDLPVKEMIVSWRDAELKRGGARKKTQREITQRLLACCSERRDVNVLEVLYELEKYLNYKAYLFENATLIQRLFGVDILAPQNDTPQIWETLATLCRDCVTFDRQLHALEGDVRTDAAKWMRNFTQEDAQRASSLCVGIMEMRTEMDEVRTRFLRYLDVDEKSFRDEYRDTLFDEIPKFLKDLSCGMDGFQQWTEWLTASDVARENGFEQVLDAVFSGQLSGETLEDAYARAFFSALCEFVFLKHPILSQLRGAAFEERLSALREKRQRVYELARQDIRAKHLRRYTSFLQESGWDASGRLALTPAAFAKNPYPITCRYPVLVASAQDAIRYLDNTPVRFQLLVLDDAQTLTLPSALALIPRAEKVVVLGSPNLYEYRTRLVEPTDSFLRRRRESVASFWTAACAAVEPMVLSYTHRSSAPLLDVTGAACAQAFDSIPFALGEGGVRTIKTPGQYDPISCVNLPEAVQTVEEIVSILEKHHRSGEALSLGVCASTVAQKLLILQTLAKRLRENSELYAVLRDAKEPFYVSSLAEEPMQSRDTVLWSVTLSATKNSATVSRTFPLLCDPNGSRRIISVVGAATHKLCVLHSFHTDALSGFRICTDASDTFCRVMRSILSEQAGDVRAIVDDRASYDNPIAERICAFLVERGYRVSYSMRCGKFAIDFVARHEKHPEFALALMMDESVFAVCSSYVLGECALLDELRAHGFTPFHVRATDWFENDQAVLDAISAVLPERGR